MDIVKKHLTNGQYLTTVFEKLSILIHHTASTNAMSAWRWWNATPKTVGAPYIIERDGSIIECFDPKYWAYHLGSGEDLNWYEKHSISIEMVSAGPLRFIENEYRFYPLWPNKLHYTSIPEEEVYTLDKPWNGFKYWHLYTEDQLESLKWLVGRICLDFPSIKVGNNIDKVFQFDEKIVKEHLQGLWSHNTINQDKPDTFPYPPLIKALKEVQKELENIDKVVNTPEIGKSDSKPKKVTYKKK